MSRRCAPSFEFVVLQRERERARARERERKREREKDTHTHTHIHAHTHTIEIEVLYERFHLGNNVEVVQEIRHQMLRYYDACLAALVWG